MMLSFPLIAGRERAGISEATYPKLSSYLDRLQEEKGYLVAVEKIKEIDGKYEIMFET